MLKHCVKRKELALARPPLGRLISLLGDTSFAWVLDADLQPLSCEQHESYLAALVDFAKRHKPKKVASQAARAVAALRGDGEEWFPPWDEDSDSEADEAGVRADAAEAAAAGATEAGRQADASALDKKGLTPDWVVDAACAIFGLEKPTLENPLIKGLCDPCTNDKGAPNIPAEVLYDRKDDGLKVSNSWSNKFVLLNRASRVGGFVQAAD